MSKVTNLPRAPILERIGSAKTFDSIVSRAPHGLLGERIITPLGQRTGELPVHPRCVAACRPTELRLFDRCENRQQRRPLDQLARISAKLAILPTVGHQHPTLG